MKDKSSTFKTVVLIILLTIVVATLGIYAITIIINAQDATNVEHNDVSEATSNTENNLPLLVNSMEIKAHEYGSPTIGYVNLDSDDINQTVIEDKLNHNNDIIVLEPNSENGEYPGWRIFLANPQSRIESAGVDTSMEWIGKMNSEQNADYFIMKSQELDDYTGYILQADHSRLTAFKGASGIAKYQLEDGCEYMFLDRKGRVMMILQLPEQNDLVAIETIQTLHADAVQVETTTIVTNN